ncbi:MFS transporter [Gordonia rubripertincta]|uniref:MFS transporter n=1 Tax=Gordonia rubripertincta TaxID=36822 RepID=A0ABT4MST5_GORRU|nr:MFS transporter [Gordonia rubripertincta]MCZ4548797.1 MFS transporter [Gordonia rubripertincta]
MPTDTRRWVMLAASLLGAMATTCVVSGVAFLIPELHRTEGLSLAQASTLAAVPMVGLLLSTIAWGFALDRFGERRILLLSLTLTVAATGSACLADALGASEFVLGALLLVAGITSAATNGAGGRIVVGWFPPERRGTAMGVRQMAQPLGIGVCALTMPVLAEKYGVTAGLAVPFVVTILATIFVAAVIIDPPREKMADGSAITSPNPYRGSSFLPRVHGVSVLLSIPQSMLWTFVPAWLIVQHEWSALTAGVLVTISQVLGAFGRIAAGRWSDSWGSRTKPIRLIAIGATASVGLLAFTDWLDSPTAALVMVVASVITVADNGLAFTAIAEFAGPQWSGRGLAIQNTGQYLWMAASTPVFGLAIGAFGYPAAFLLSAAAPAVAVGLVPADEERKTAVTVS